MLSVLQVHAQYLRLMHQLILRHHLLSLEVTNALQLLMAFFCHQQALVTPEYRSSRSHSRHIQDQRLGFFFKVDITVARAEESLE